MSYRVIENKTGAILHEGLSYSQAETYREKHRDADAYTIEDMHPAPKPLSDEGLRQADQLLLNTIEELMILRIHLQNDEIEEAREKLHTCGVNLHALSASMEVGV